MRRTEVELEWPDRKWLSGGRGGCEEAGRRGSVCADPWTTLRHAKRIPRLLQFGCLLLLLVPLLGQETPKPLPPLDHQQADRVRELVRTNRVQMMTLQTRLQVRQRELARLYAQYDLDEQLAKELQAEILQLQRELLAGHHQMQVQLRTIVSRERFEVLRRRLLQAAQSRDQVDGQEAPLHPGASSAAHDEPQLTPRK